MDLDLCRGRVGPAITEKIASSVSFRQCLPHLACHSPLVSSWIYDVHASHGLTVKVGREDEQSNGVASRKDALRSGRRAQRFHPSLSYCSCLTFSNRAAVRWNGATGLKGQIKKNGRARTRPCGHISISQFRIALGPRDPVLPFRADPRRNNRDAFRSACDYPDSSHSLNKAVRESFIDRGEKATARSS